MKIENFKTMSVYTDELTAKNKIQIVKDEKFIWVLVINASSKAWSGRLPTLGKNFKTWAEAENSYKSKKTKAAIKKASEFLV